MRDSEGFPAGQPLLMVLLTPSVVIDDGLICKTNLLENRRPNKSHHIEQMFKKNPQNSLGKLMVLKRVAAQ